MKYMLLALSAWILLAIPVHAQVISVANEGSTGTTVNHLAKLTGAPSTAILTGTGDVASTSPMGVVVIGAGTTGNAGIATGGIVSCVFDAGGVTAGHAVINSAATAGDCKDGGVPPNVNAVGIAIQTVASGAANMIALAPWGR